MAVVGPPFWASGFWSDAFWAEGFWASIVSGPVGPTESLPTYVMATYSTNDEDVMGCME